MRWFRFLCRRSCGAQIESGHYIGFSIYDFLFDTFDAFCINDSEIVGHKSLRDKLKDIYFEATKKKKRRKKKKRKREPLDSDEDGHITTEAPEEIPIYGLGVGNFDKLIWKIRIIRTQYRGRYLSFKVKNTIIQFFSIFNKQFQNESEEFRDISKIECRIISREFNDKYGFHGPPGRGVAFIFHVVLMSGETDERHYCLGYNRNCDTACSADYFAV